jgi:hypothetical protein
MINELTSLITAHPKYFFLLLFAAFAFSAYGCYWLHLKIKANSNQTTSRVFCGFLAGILSILFTIFSYICFITLTEWWYLAFLLVFPEVPLVLYWLGKNAVLGLKMTARDIKPEIEGQKAPGDPNNT